MIPDMDQFAGMDSYEALCSQLGDVTLAEMEQEVLSEAHYVVPSADLDDCIPY